MDADQITRCLRTRLLAVLVAVLALGSMAVGCGDVTGDDASAGTNPPVDQAVSSTTPPEPADGVALVVTDDGLAGVPVGSVEPRWVAPGAVAAPDGSAVFGSRRLPEAEGSSVQLLRIDPETGAEEAVGRPLTGTPELHVAAVEPGGGRVVLAAPDPGADRTLILDVDGATGLLVRSPTFEGTLEPEAYSTDRSLLFAARIYEDRNRYHVHALELATSQQWPTLGPDKALEPEDMYGTVVQAALSPDGTQLATLYRDSVKPEHTAFVHLLALENGTTVCIDLHEPFGGTGVGRDAITWRDDGTVAVGHRADDPAQSVTATFDPAAIWSGEPAPHYHAEVQPDPEPPTIPAGVGEVPGFRRFVALVPTTP